MGQISREIRNTETLQLEACPCCGGDVFVDDCGLSAVNPGWAECRGQCKRKWSFDHVDDQWSAGLLWNKRAVEIRDKLVLLDQMELQVKSAEAVQLLAEFMSFIIGANEKS